jgi:hypothetical protein
MFNQDFIKLAEKIEVKLFNIKKKSLSAQPLDLRFEIKVVV